MEAELDASRSASLRAQAFLGRGEQRRRLAERWTFLPLVLAAMSAIAAGATEHPLGFFGIGVLLVTSQLVMHIAGAEDRADEQDALGAVEIVPTGIVSIEGGATIFALSELDAGWLEGPESAVVRTRWGHHLRLVFAAPEARAALEALGLHAGGRAVRLPLAGLVASRLDGPAADALGRGAKLLRLLVPAFAMLPALAAGGLFAAAAGRSLAAELAGALLAIVAVLGLAAFARLARRDAVIVGSESIVVERMFGVSSLSWRDVVEVQRRGPLTRLSLRADAYIELRTAAGGAGLAERICEAKSAFDATGSDPRAAILDRGERTLAGWAEHLARVARGTTDYRNAALGADELAAVVTDASAPADRRVGAAFLLAGNEGGAPHRERVRIATEACADEGVRYALQAAAEGELVADEMMGVRARSMRDR